jgi:hypothetical protein
MRVSFGWRQCPHLLNTRRRTIWFGVNAVFKLDASALTSGKPLLLLREDKWVAWAYFWGD